VYVVSKVDIFILIRV